MIPNPALEIINSGTDYDELEDYMYNLSLTLAYNEYESYCNKKPLSKVPPHLIQYWIRQVINTPSLAQMALDLYQDVLWPLNVSVSSLA